MGDGDGIGGAIGDILGDALGEIKKIGQAATGQVTGSSDGDKPKADSPVISDVSVGSEANSFGKGIISQITGKKLEEMQGADREFSEQAQAQIRAKINAMYAQHAQKAKKEKMMDQQQEKQAEQQNKELKVQEKKQSADVANAQMRASAEKNRNVGGE